MTHSPRISLAAAAALGLLVMGAGAHCSRWGRISVLFVEPERWHAREEYRRLASVRE
jgi:hypothetical protein